MNPPTNILEFIVTMVTVLTAQSSALSSNKRPMSKARQDMILLQNEIYSHPAVKNRLVPYNQNREVLLNVTLKFSQVFGLDEVTEIVDSFVFFFVMWEDKDLGWRPEMYSGIKEVQLAQERIWSPTLNVVNAGNLDSFMIGADQIVHLYFNGTISYVAIKYLKTSCPLNLHYYPMDTQECHISVVPARYSTPGLHIIHAQVADLKIAANVKGEWIVSDKMLNMSDLAGYSLADFRLRLDRRQLFYIVCILSPMAITSILVVLVFCIPPNSGDRMSYLVSIFLANTVVLNIVGDNMPRSIEDMPLLLQVILLIIASNTLAMGCTMFVMRKYEEEQMQPGHSDDVTAAECKDDSPGDIFTSKVQARKIKLADTGSKSRSKDALQPFRLSHDDLQNSETVKERQRWTCSKLHGLETEGQTLKSSRTVSCRKKMTSIKAKTWDKIFFVLFLSIFVTFSFAMCWR